LNGSICARYPHVPSGAVRSRISLRTCHCDFASANPRSASFAVNGARGVWACIAHGKEINAAVASLMEVVERIRILSPLGASLYQETFYRLAPVDGKICGAGLLLRPQWPVAFFRAEARLRLGVTQRKRYFLVFFPESNLRNASATSPERTCNRPIHASRPDASRCLCRRAGSGAQGRRSR
jgi:hypothetical protein